MPVVRDHNDGIIRRSGPLFELAWRPTRGRRGMSPRPPARCTMRLFSIWRRRPRSARPARCADPSSHVDLHRGSCARYSSATSVTSAFSAKRVSFRSGARAYSLKALTMAFSASTCCTMVYVARSRTARPRPSACCRAPPQALGGQLDRRQRILDLVREAARDFAPGRVALRLQQRGDVVEHDDVAALASASLSACSSPGSGVQAHTSTRAPRHSGLRSICSRQSSSPLARRALDFADEARVARVRRRPAPSAAGRCPGSRSTPRMLPAAWLALRSTRSRADHDHAGGQARQDHRQALALALHQPAGCAWSPRSRAAAAWSCR